MTPLASYRKGANLVRFSLSMQCMQCSPKINLLLKKMKINIPVESTWTDCNQLANNLCLAASMVLLFTQSVIGIKHTKGIFI